VRVIQVIVPEDKETIVERVFKNIEIQHIKLKAEKNVFYVLQVTEEEAELVIDALRKIGVGTVYGSIQVPSTELLITSQIRRGDQRQRFVSKATREELLMDISDRAKLSFSYILFTISSSIIAALGLLNDNVIMVIASMIIAPLIGPIVGLALGTTLGLSDLQKESFKSEIVGVLLSIIIGFITAYLDPTMEVTEQIALRANPMYTDIIFAVAAGLAAALSIISLEALALVGVAIAASLLPPAVNVGVGIAFYFRGHEYGEVIVVGSTTLLLINILAINFTTLVFFWATGITTQVSARKRALVVRNVKRRLGVIFLLILIVAYPIVMATLTHFKKLEIESNIKNDISSYITKNYNVEIIDIDVNYLEIINKCSIYITLAVNTNVNLTQLANNIKKLIEEKYSINTEVYIIQYVRSELFIYGNTLGAIVYGQPSRSSISTRIQLARLS